MAQKIQILLEDDIDASTADETLAFALDGRDYLIDLNKKHAAELRDSLALYLGHARTAGGKRTSRKPTPPSASDAGAIREWAQANGYEVSQRGRISAELRAAYAAAT